MKYLLYDIPRRLLHFVRWTGWWTGICLWLLMVFRIRRRVRVTVAGQELTVRSSTPDIIVAASSLVYREYSNIRHDDPRLIIDAGANIGTSAIWFALTFPGAIIVAVEPEAENFELLCENTARFSNIKPLHGAIWSSETIRELNSRQTGEWGYTLSENVENGQPVNQQIACHTIESILASEGFDQVDILKMDIEGGEKEVLESADSWIDRVAVLTVELHDRIVMGCDRAFYLATRNFSSFEKSGEKVTAYRDPPNADNPTPAAS